MKIRQRTILPVLSLFVLALAALLATPAQAQPTPAEKKSDVVHVTGTLTDEGVECPALRGDDGQLYTLTPRDLQGFSVGDRVRVTGKLAERSFCQQGTTIEVKNIKAAK